MADEIKDTLTTTLMSGAFIETLKRNNKQIRDDRASDIVDAAEMTYRRKIEDIETEIRKLRKSRDNMLDLSPTNAQSLILASDFKEDEFVNKDIQIGLMIREKEITLEIAKNQYKILFGK